MKRTIAAWLLLSWAGATLAQSGLIVSGGIDLAVAHYQGAGGGSRTQLISGGNQNSRLNIRGREDLGAGWYAGFELEAGLAADTGTGLTSNINNQVSGIVPAGSGGATALTFNRRSIVGIGGDWGELRLGRDYVPSFWPIYLYDPFRTGVGFGGITILGSTVTNLRASNSIGYFTPGCDAVCKGPFAQLMYAFGENGSGSPAAHDGRVLGMRLGYGAPTWEVSVARSKTTSVAVADFTQTSGGGYFETRWARLMLLVGENRTGRPVAALNNGTRAPFWQLGALVYLPVGYLPVAYTRVTRNDLDSSSASKISFGYVYPLSKRTAVYTTYARISNKKALAIPVNVGADAGPTPEPGGGASGWDVGIRLTF
jgi:predicted porin